MCQTNRRGRRGRRAPWDPDRGGRCLAEGGLSRYRRLPWVGAPRAPRRRRRGRSCRGEGPSSLHIRPSRGRRRQARANEVGKEKSPSACGEPSSVAAAARGSIAARPGAWDAHQPRSLRLASRDSRDPGLSAAAHSPDSRLCGGAPYTRHPAAAAGVLQPEPQDVRRVVGGLRHGLYAGDLRPARDGRAVHQGDDRQAYRTRLPPEHRRHPARDPLPRARAADRQALWPHPEDGPLQDRGKGVPRLPEALARRAARAIPARSTTAMSLPTFARASTRPTATAPS